MSIQQNVNQALMTAGIGARMSEEYWNTKKVIKTYDKSTEEQKQTREQLDKLKVPKNQLNPMDNNSPYKDKVIGKIAELEGKKKVLGELRKSSLDALKSSAKSTNMGSDLARNKWAQEYSTSEEREMNRHANYYKKAEEKYIESLEEKEEFENRLSEEEAIRMDAQRNATEKAENKVKQREDVIKYMADMKAKMDAIYKNKGPKIEVNKGDK